MNDSPPVTYVRYAPQPPSLPQPPPVVVEQSGSSSSRRSSSRRSASRTKSLNAAEQQLPPSPRISYMDNDASAAHAAVAAAHESAPVRPAPPAAVAGAAAAGSSPRRPGAAGRTRPVLNSAQLSPWESDEQGATQHAHFPPQQTQQQSQSSEPRSPSATQKLRQSSRDSASNSGGGSSLVASADASPSAHPFARLSSGISFAASPSPSASPGLASSELSSDADLLEHHRSHPAAAAADAASASSSAASGMVARSASGSGSGSVGVNSQSSFGSLSRPGTQQSVRVGGIVERLAARVRATGSGVEAEPEGDQQQQTHELARQQPRNLEELAQQQQQQQQQSSDANLRHGGSTSRRHHGQQEEEGQEQEEDDNDRDDEYEDEGSEAADAFDSLGEESLLQQQQQQQQQHYGAYLHQFQHHHEQQQQQEEAKQQFPFMQQQQQSQHHPVPPIANFSTAAAATPPATKPTTAKSQQQPKLSHRWIVERLYGPERAQRILSPPSADEAGHGSSSGRGGGRPPFGMPGGGSSSASHHPSGSASARLPSHDVAASLRRSGPAALLSLGDDLATPGSLARVRDGTATLLSGPSTARPSTTPGHLLGGGCDTDQVHGRPSSAFAYGEKPAPMRRGGTANNGSTVARVGVRTLRALTASTPLSSQSATPRFTQASHAARLSSGQTIVRPPGENAWIYLTALRKAQEEAREERAQRASERLRGRDGSHPPPSMMTVQQLQQQQQPLTRLQRRASMGEEHPALPGRSTSSSFSPPRSSAFGMQRSSKHNRHSSSADAAHDSAGESNGGSGGGGSNGAAVDDDVEPMYQRLGGALPSAQKWRRPPAASAFHDASLSAGVVHKVSRKSARVYRMASDVPASLHVQTEPRIVAWRLDTAAWLAAHPRSGPSGGSAAVSSLGLKATATGSSSMGTSAAASAAATAAAAAATATSASSRGRAVTAAQMRELRVLYDALDHDGSDALDLSELAAALRVCGLREEFSRDLAGKMLDWMGKARNDCLSFAEFAFAVLHFEVPVRTAAPAGSGGGSSRSSRAASRHAFGSAAKRTEPLFTRMMHGDGQGGSQRTSFARAVLEFKRKRLYEQLKSAAVAADAASQQQQQQLQLQAQQQQQQLQQSA